MYSVARAGAGGDGDCKDDATCSRRCSTRPAFDTTAANVAPGNLPETILAKTVILTKTGAARHTPQFDYVSQAAQADGEVILKHRYHEHPGTVPCAPEESRARRAMQLEIVENFASKVVFKQQ